MVGIRRRLPMLLAAAVALGAWMSYPSEPGAASGRVVAFGDGTRVVRIAGGGTRVDFKVRMHMDYRLRARGPGGSRAVRPVNGFRPASAQGPGLGSAHAWQLKDALRFGPVEVDFSWVGGPGSAGVGLEVRVVYRRKTFVRTEAVELVSPCSRMRVLHRNESFVWARPSVRHRADRWTHMYAEVTGAGGNVWALTGAAGLSGMSAVLVRPVHGPAARRRTVSAPKPGSPTRSSGSSVCRLLLELDDSRNHPVVYASRCKRFWYPPSVRLLRSRRLRFPGETVTRRFRFRLGPGVAVHKLRLPSGFAAAAVFTDHADQSAPGPLRAILLGRSDAAFASAPGGFVGNGLRFTKTLFLKHGPYPQMDHQPVRRAAGEAHRRGIEFGPHSATPRADPRAVTEQALLFFKRFGATWIDHQPDTNCEAYSCRGWNPQSPFFIADLLVKHGLRYVWTGQDAKLKRGGINLLQPAQTQVRASFLYPFHALGTAPSRIWLFRSVWFHQGPAAFARRLNTTALDRLILERGIFIAHTYLDAHFGPRHRKRRLALVRRGPSGVWALHPKVESTLGRMGRLQRAGRLWVPSLKELADHLTGWNRVELLLGKGGRLFIRNPGPRPVAGLTVRVHAPVGTVRGAKARVVSSGQASEITVTVPASGTVALVLLAPDGGPVNLVQ